MDPETDPPGLDQKKTQDDGVYGYLKQALMKRKQHGNACWNKNYYKQNCSGRALRDGQGHTGCFD